MWRGGTGIYQGNHLTFASSIAYYSLLSLFPFFLLVFSIIAWRLNASFWKDVR